MPIAPRSLRSELRRVHRASLYSASRIFVVSGLRLLREALRQVLTARGFNDVALLSPADVTDAVLIQRADIVVVDVGHPPMMDVVCLLTRREPPLRVIAYGIEEVRQDVLACAAAGAMAYARRDCTADELSDVIDRVQRDELLCSPHVAALLFRGHGSHPSSAERAPLLQLTMRERQVLAQIDLGLSNQEIAGHLNITVATVKHHVHRVLTKLGVRRRWAAAALYRGV